MDSDEYNEKQLILRVNCEMNLLRSVFWLVRFPQLEVARLAQRYTRLRERLYRYESRSGAFTALDEVDELGLVVDYEGMWVRGKV